MQPLILIVESNQALRQALRSWLAALHPQCRVLTARTGASGVRAVCRLAPHIVVMDVQRPRRNGLVAARRIKAHAPATNIVIFTLCDAAAYRTAATQAGACGYVLKHRAAQELLPLLERLLQGTATRRFGGAAAHRMDTKEYGQTQEIRSACK